MFAAFLISSNANAVVSLGKPGVSDSVFLVNNPAVAPPAIGIRFFIRLFTIPPDLSGVPMSVELGSLSVLISLPYKIS